ncbi:MAG: hypothetical protein J5896_06065 [Alphaproteobacteria bacterium]|nr:hypothetical protein [Alphaproteobacteria bacterium]
MKLFSIEHVGHRWYFKCLGRTMFRISGKSDGAYGIKAIFREYVGRDFKGKLVEIQHGWTPLETALVSDLEKANEKDCRAMLAWNKRYKDDWDKKSKVPCYVTGAPFVLYRRMKGIEQNKDAKGTIAYPAHSIQNMKANFDIDEYCNKLKALPAEFHPITISLHPVDIDEFHMDEEYKKRGFDTVCAAKVAGKSFHEIFYDILRQFKYATSNEPGSYTFYAVEMGVPFFILGEPAISNNSDGRDPNVPKGDFSIIDFKYGKTAYELFSKKPFGQIAKEQQDFVLSEVGLTDCVSQTEIKNIFKNLKKKG